MSDSPKKKVRWRENRLSEPGPGGLRVQEVMVHETQEAPLGAQIVETEPHGWMPDTKSD